MHYFLGYLLEIFKYFKTLQIKMAKKKIKKKDQFTKKELKGLFILAVILIIAAIFARFLLVIGIVLQYLQGSCWL